MLINYIKNGKQNTWVFCVSFAFAVITYHLVFFNFFPNRNDMLGHDYSYFFPSLLNGYYWFKENGLFPVPWFTPAFCGGVPYFPNPQVMYYSVPQFLTFLINPLASIYLTLILFASIGYIGMYQLARNIFRLQPVIAAYAATVFMFNGFYTYRMIIGHLTYHAFMLIPLIALILLSKKRGNRGEELRNVFFSGILIAYFIHSGAANFIVPALIIILGIWLLSVIFTGSNNVFLPRFVCAALVAFLLSISKITSSLMFMSSFPRDLYSLPGIEGFLNTILMVLISLFSNFQGEIQVANTQILYQQHSFEFGITIIPLLLIIIFILASLLKNYIPTEIKIIKYDYPRKLFIFALLVILIMPVLLNYHAPAWTNFLEGLPYIKNSSSLFRWIAVEIPLLVLISAIALEKLSIKNTNAVSALLIICVIILNILHDKEYYHSQPYNPGNIIFAYKQVQETGQIPAVYLISSNILRTKGQASSIGRNDLMIFGASQLYCYEPIFGYGLEKFPIKNLIPGNPLMIQDNFFNLKNPACYVYGEENNCKPGDHFLLDQGKSAKEFLNYKKFDFKLSLVQKTANLVSIISLIFISSCLLYLMIFVKRD